MEKAKGVGKAWRPERDRDFKGRWLIQAMAQGTGLRCAFERCAVCQSAVCGKGFLFGRGKVVLRE